MAILCRVLWRIVPKYANAGCQCGQVFDEATSALDSESEKFIQAALKKLMAARTVLIIAHRFSTIRDASMILVFEQGQIVASGPHAQVYASSRLYKSLYDLQGVGG